MKIKEIKNESLRMLALGYAFECNNNIKYLVKDLHNLRLEQAFVWSTTNEGHKFWDRVDREVITELKW